MARRIGVALVAIPAAVTRHDPVSGGPDRTVRVESADLWSGGEVVLYSAGFAPPAEPAFTLDGEPLVQRRVTDTTVAVRLPDRPGTHVITVRWGVDTLPVGPLHLRGFGNAFRGPALKGIPQVWPGGGVTSILLADAAGLVRYDVTHNLIAQRWPDSLYAPSCNFSPGTSYRPDHFVLQTRTPANECRMLVSWHLQPDPVPTDSASWFCCGWAIMEMAPGRWLVTRDDYYTVIECAAGTCASRQAWGYTTEDAVLSPRRDRVALGGFAAGQRGPWVLDTATGDSAYSVAAFHDTYAAAFSTGGDTLFLVGRAGSDAAFGEAAVLAVDAATGSHLDSVGLPAGAQMQWPAALAVDPLADYLHLAGFTGSGVLLPSPFGEDREPAQPMIVVFRRSTLDPLAVLRVPLAADPVTWWFGNVELAVIPAPVEHAVYVLVVPRIYDPPSWPVAGYRFDRIP